MEGEGGWVNVTESLRRGASAIPKDEILISPNVSLFDIMGAIKIGDPRMDMGAEVPSATPKPVFNAHRLLLPEEVVLIIDRALACEMTWHTGHSLSQTIYTCLYLHDLPLCVWAPVHSPHMEESERSDSVSTRHGAAPELTNLVLRAYMLGLAKSVDAVWEELARGNLYENEDVNTHKSGVQLQEDEPVDHALILLDRAYEWLDRWQEGAVDGTRLALMERLRFRIEFLYSLSLFYSGPDLLPELASHAGSALSGLRNATPGDAQLSSDDSRAVVDSAFDDSIARRLATEMPPRPLKMLSVEEACAKAEELLLLLFDVVAMTQGTGVFEWQRYFEHWSRRAEPAPPYIRSLLMSHFCADNIIACDATGRRDLRWLGQELVRSTTGWEGDFATVGDEVQRLVALLAGNCVAYFTTLCANRPRTRRKLGDLIPQWRDLHATATTLTISSESGLRRLPSAVLYLLLSIVLEVLLSGFDLDLYDRAEHRPMWWTIIGVLSARKAATQDLIDGLRDGQGAKMDLLESAARDEVMLGLTTVALDLTFVSDGSASHAKTVSDVNFARRMRFLDTPAPFPGQPRKPTSLLPGVGPITLSAFEDWQSERRRLGREELSSAAFERLRVVRDELHRLQERGEADGAAYLLPRERDLDLRAFTYAATRLAQRASSSDAPATTLPPPPGRERVLKWFDIE